MKVKPYEVGIRFAGFVAPDYDHDDPDAQVLTRPELYYTSALVFVDHPSGHVTGMVMDAGEATVLVLHQALDREA